jgi:type III secretion protein U
MSGEKTEQPTAKKLRDARMEGQVSHSKDLTQTVLVVALFGYLIVDGANLLRAMSDMMIMPVGVLGLDFLQAVNAVMTRLLNESVRVMAPFLLIVLLLGLFVELAQTSMLITFKPLTQVGKKLDVAANVKNMFSMKNLFEFLKSCAKIVLLSAIVYTVIAEALPGLTTLPRAGLVGVGLAVGAMLQSMLLKVALGYSLIAAVDFFWQKKNHAKQLKMSKHEVEQEFKESEGDPHIKGERKQRHMEMLNETSVGRSREASVLVTNPIHVAVAVLYRKGATALPVVTAKGRDALARRMVHAARQAGVPVMENVPLAWSLLETADVDAYIPEDLIEPVAEVLRLVRAAAGESDLPEES